MTYYLKCVGNEKKWEMDICIYNHLQCNNVKHHNYILHYITPEYNSWLNSQKCYTNEPLLCIKHTSNIACIHIQKRLTCQQLAIKYKCLF